MLTLLPPIGLLGGSFNPIHWGHLLPIAKIATELALQKVKLIPCHYPPHKQTPEVDSETRAKMVQLACQQLLTDPQYPIEMDPLELSRQTPSYTLDTLSILERQYPNHPLCFIMGMDSLINFHHWYRYEQILEKCHLIVTHRPGFELDDTSHAATMLSERLTQNPQDIASKRSGHIYLTNIEPIDISSTKIRERIKRQQAVDHLLPPSVLLYINQWQLYRHS